MENDSKKENFNALKYFKIKKKNCKLKRLDKSVLNEVNGEQKNRA